MSTPTETPELQHEQYLGEVLVYIEIALLGAVIWDYLILTPYEYRVLWRNRDFNPISFAYICCRHSGAAIAVFGTVMLIGKPWSCDAVYKIVLVFWAMSQTSAAYIFWQRVYALYSRKSVINWIFGIMWLGLVCVWIAIIPYFHFQQFTLAELTNPYNGWCYGGYGPPWTSVAWAASCAFDLAIFIATLIQLLKMHELQNASQTTRIFFRDGFVYFLLSLIVNVLTLSFLVGIQNAYIRIFMQPIAIFFNFAVPPRIVLDLKALSVDGGTGPVLTTPHVATFGSAITGRGRTARSASVAKSDAKSLTDNRGYPFDAGRFARSSVPAASFEMLPPPVPSRTNHLRQNLNPASPGIYIHRDVYEY